MRLTSLSNRKLLRIAVTMMKLQTNRILLGANLAPVTFTALNEEINLFFRCIGSFEMTPESLFFIWQRGPVAFSSGGGKLLIE